MGGKKSNIYEGIIYKANFKNSPNKKVIEHILDLKLKDEEGIYLLVDLIKNVWVRFMDNQSEKISMESKP